MSSDSEESNISAQVDDGGNTGAGSIAPDSPIESQGTEDRTESTTAHGEEEAQQELESLDSGANDLTFARQRKAQGVTDEDVSSSDLPIRKATTRPRSLESTSTPDDTPSIQVSARYG